MRHLVILSVLALATLSYARPGESQVNVYDIIAQEGYPVQRQVVRTVDGYILDLVRIPGPRPYKNEWEASPQTETGKIVVVLMHGLLGSADEFVVGGAQRGLAFKLADRGYDVFLANARGSKYGRKHTYLHPNIDPAFWRYNWDQIGSRDLPAIIDKIINVTKQKKMDFIGYNQGNTAFFVMASEKPEYNSRIKKMIALGPMVYMEHAHHAFMSRVRANLQNPNWLAKNIAKNEFYPSQDLLNQITQDCLNKNIDQQVCDNVYFLVNGYSQNFNQTIVPALRQSPPLGVAARQILHYAELLNTNSFTDYDNNYKQEQADSSSSDSDENSDSDEQQGQSQPSAQGEQQPRSRPYDLRDVTANIYLLYVPNDSWSSRQDISSLANDLPNAKETYAYEAYSSNVDLILAKDAYQKVNDKVLNILQ